MNRSRLWECVACGNETLEFESCNAFTPGSDNDVSRDVTELPVIPSLWSILLPCCSGREECVRRAKEIYDGYEREVVGDREVQEVEISSSLLIASMPVYLAEGWYVVDERGGVKRTKRESEN